MARYTSGTASVLMDEYVPDPTRRHPALLVLHGSGGAALYWMGRFSPALRDAGVAILAPHYFERTGTARVAAETIVDGHHFSEWHAAIKDAFTYAVGLPFVDRERIGVLGISLGAYLAVALGIEERRMRAVVAVSGGVPPGWEDRISAQMPPTLIAHGEEDEVVPVAEARKLESLLEARDVVHETALLPNQGHWFDTMAQAELLMRCAAFLGRHLLAPSDLRMAG